MTILFTSPSFWFTDSKDNIGGEPKIAWEMISRLAKRGHRCIVISPETLLENSYPNIQVYTIPNADFRKGKNRTERLSRLFRFMRASRKLSKQIEKQEKIDIVHHIRPAYIGFPFIGLHLKAPKVFGMLTVKYSRIEENPNEINRKNIVQRFKEWDWNRKLKKLDGIILEVEYARNDFDVPAETNCLTLPNGIDTNVFVPNANKKQNAVPVVLYLASVRRNKGAHIFLEAVKKLVDQGLEFKVVLAGKHLSGEFADYIKSNQLESVIDSKGSVSQKEALSLYQNSDIYCLPSLQDSCPSSLMEAMSCSLPIVTSKVMGIPEVVKTDGGFLCEPKNVDELKDALAVLISDSELRNKMGCFNRKRVIENFDWKIFLERLENFYKELQK